MIGMARRTETVVIMSHPPVELQCKKNDYNIHDRDDIDEKWMMNVYKSEKHNIRMINIKNDGSNVVCKMQQRCASQKQKEKITEENGKYMENKT